MFEVSTFEIGVIVFYLYLIVSSHPMLHISVTPFNLTFTVLIILLVLIGFHLPALLNTLLQLALTFILLLRKFQHHLLYIPVIDEIKSPSENKIFKNPQSVGLTYKDVEINTSDHEVLRGWLIPTQKEEAPLMVFFHQNAGNIGNRLPFLRQYHKTTQLNLLIIAYRGYSDSSGTPTEEGLQIDASAILRYAMGIPQAAKGLYLHGRSLGGAVTIYCASNPAYRLQGIIIENTFTSISDMVKVVLPNLSVFRFLALSQWPSLKMIEMVSCPILFIKGMEDELVPAEMMEELQKNAKSAGVRWKYEIASGTHNMTWSLNPEEYFGKVNEFIKHVGK